MLLAIICWQNSNFSSEFKLELITTYHQKFVGKVLWKYCGHNILWTSFILLLVCIMDKFVIKKSRRPQDFFFFFTQNASSYWPPKKNILEPPLLRTKWGLNYEIFYFWVGGRIETRFNSTSLLWHNNEISGKKGRWKGIIEEINVIQSLKTTFTTFCCFM